MHQKGYPAIHSFIYKIPNISISFLINFYFTLNLVFLKLLYIFLLEFVYYSLLTFCLVNHSSTSLCLYKIARPIFKKSQNLSLFFRILIFVCTPILMPYLFWNCSGVKYSSLIISIFFIICSLK